MIMIMIIIIIIIISIIIQAWEFSVLNPNSGVLLTKIYAILFNFSPFLGVFCTTSRTFSGFSSSSGFDMKVHSHA